MAATTGSTTTGRSDVLVVGSGPSGLACAAALTARGVPTTVLEKGATTAAVWAARYDGLRLNTSRVHSALPGAPFPRSFGQFPTRDQYVGYLRGYAERAGVRVEHGCTVTSIRRGSRSRWVVETSDGEREADDVVVATGLYNRPTVPPWARGARFRGRLLHTVDYRTPTPFAGQDVVVVGAGSTGMEVAKELADAGARVRLSVRTPPTILLRETAGIPADLPTPLFLHLPARWVDAVLRQVQLRTVGDLAPYGVPLPVEGAITALRRRGAGTAIVDRDVVDAIRSGTIRVITAVAGLDEDAVVLVDGTRRHADAVVLATGFGTGLEDVVGHLGVLDGRGMPRDGDGAEVLPGLRFAGYVLRPGIIGYVGRTARRVARETAVARSRAGVPA